MAIQPTNKVYYSLSKFQKFTPNIKHYNRKELKHINNFELSFGSLRGRTIT